MRFLRSVLWMMWLAVVAACSSFQTNLQDTSVDYLDTAEENYEAAQAAQKDGKNNEAIKFYEHVRNKFPYSKYAVLAELRTADTQFAREKWLEAADAYRVFARYHPRSDQVAYALFRVCQAHSNAIEQAWLPMLDPVQKDQTPARDTVRACDDFVARFPKDEQAAKATQLRTDARSRLADVDLLVADFYASRGRYQGAVWRLLSVVNEYGDTPQAPQALARAARLTAQHLPTQSAKPLWQRLLKAYPDSAFADEATKGVDSACTTCDQPATGEP
jgi:outer membrane protein assembly factor BamD